MSDEQPTEAIIDESKEYEIQGAGLVRGSEIRKVIALERDYQKEHFDVQRKREDFEKLQGLSTMIDKYAMANPAFYNDFIRFTEAGGDPSKYTTIGQKVTPDTAANPEKPNTPTSPQVPPQTAQRVRDPEYDRVVADMQELKRQTARQNVDLAIEKISKEYGLDIETIDKEIMPIAIDNMVQGKTAEENLRNAYRIWGFDNAVHQGERKGVERIQSRLNAQFLGGKGRSGESVKNDAESLTEWLSSGGEKSSARSLILKGS